jgi:hypothetical protein
VAKALREVAKVTAESAKAADPAAASDSAGFEKAGLKLDAACKKAGVDPEFD